MSVDSDRRSFFLRNTRWHGNGWRGANPYSETIVRLQAKIIEVLDRVAPGTENFALVDFPGHDNVGDSAIWLGELAFFRNHRHATPRFVTTHDLDRFSELGRVVPEGTIYIHGGGNFGDLYPWYQEFRERLLARFPRRRIVQLPQTLHFSNQVSLERTARAIERQGNFTLLVRDLQSYELARSTFNCTVELCPDMAFAIGPVRRLQPTRDLQILIRRDNERDAKVVLEEAIALGSPAEDWPDSEEVFHWKFKLRSLFSAATTTPGLLNDRQRLREFYYRLMAERRLQRGVEMLSIGSMLVTDRLHGHILALLLGIPHRTIDNKYGKLQNFISMWTADAAKAASDDRLARAVEALSGQKR